MNLPNLDANSIYACHGAGYVKSICKSLHSPLEMENGSCESKWTKGVFPEKGEKCVNVCVHMHVCAYVWSAGVQGET